MKLNRKDPPVSTRGIEIITETETETVDCWLCYGEGLESGNDVVTGYRLDTPCPKCDGLGTLTNTYERKYIVMPDGTKEPLVNDGYEF